MRGFAPNSIDCECAYYRDGLDSMRGFGFQDSSSECELPIIFGRLLIKLLIKQRASHQTWEALLCHAISN